ncbi:MAG: transposase [Zetaproteobacteria bacterium]|nr:MAG: transposase [Zetaproteobacteria bacterium]
MVQCQIKLCLTRAQEAELDRWLWHFTGVYNWAIRKIGCDAAGGIYYRKRDFQNLLAGHGRKLGIPFHTLQGVLVQVRTASDRCGKRLDKNPRLKGHRNRLNSIPLPDPIKRPDGCRIKVPSIGSIRFHKQDIPDGRIKCGRIIKRASGWYLALSVDAQPNIVRTFKMKAHREVGIDSGYMAIVTLSDGERVDAPKECSAMEKRLTQAQRSGNRKLVEQLHEGIVSRKKDRNHKLSRYLVGTCAVMTFVHDNNQALQQKPGKSVANANIHQLQKMLAYKSSSFGRWFELMDGCWSTRTCSAYGSLAGPKGRHGLSVRRWVSEAYGASHERDIDTARNALISAVGSVVEEARDAA